MKRNPHSRWLVVARSAFVVCLVLGCSCSLWAQAPSAQANTQSPAHPLPKDLKSLAAALVSLNGLDRNGTQSFHVKITYDHFDSDGDNDSSGSYEEWWVGPKKYKRKYAGDNLDRTEWETDRGLYVTGGHYGPGSAFWIRVTDPLYRISVLGRSTTLNRVQLSIGKMKLPCIWEGRTDMSLTPSGRVTYCFEPDEGELRYIRGMGCETTYNQIIRFRDSYVARDVEVAFAGKKSLQIHLETLEPDFQLDELKPSADAVFVGNGIYVPSAFVLDGEPFPFPMKYDGPSGKAEVTMTVDAEGRGHVADVKAVEGPTELVPAVTKMASSIKFRPFIVHGAPLEVRTLIHISITVKGGGAFEFSIG